MRNFLGRCLHLLDAALCQQREVLIVPCPAVLAVLPRLVHALEVGQCLRLLELALCQQRVVLDVTCLAVLTQRVVVFPKDLSLAYTLEGLAECLHQVSLHVYSVHQPHLCLPYLRDPLFPLYLLIVSVCTFN